MRSIAATYYKRLLVEDRRATWEDMRDDIVLQSLSQKVMYDMNTWLACPLSIIEIWDALSELDVDNCPRMNGLTPHFFTSLWDFIKEDIIHAYEEIITYGNQPKEFGQGMMHLIPKGSGNANDMSKQQPCNRSNKEYRMLVVVYVTATTRSNQHTPLHQGQINYEI